MLAQRFTDFIHQLNIDALLGWENAADGPLPELEPEFVDENGNEPIYFVFQKSKTATNLNYSVEVSDSLQEPEAVKAWNKRNCLERPIVRGSIRLSWIRPPIPRPVVLCGCGSLRLAVRRLAFECVIWPVI